MTRYTRYDTETGALVEAEESPYASDLRRQLRARDERIAALEAELAAQKQKTAAILNERINSVAEWKAAGELDNEALDFNLRQRIAALEAENAEQRVNMARIGIKLDDAYLRGYADAVRFVEAEAAQRDAARAEGRGE